MPLSSSSLFPATLLVVSGSLLLPAPSPADERGNGVSGFIAAGVGVTPDYEGSSDYEPVPLIIGQIEAFDLGFEFQGLTARLNVRPDAAFQFGPVVSFRPGRDDVSNDTVDELSDIDDAVEVGGFFRYVLDDLFRSGDELELGVEVLADVGDAHEGLTAGLSLGYAMTFGERWRVGLDTGATYATDDYMQTYFGIDAVDAGRSGLPVFDADAGFKDVGVGATLSYNFSERWGAFGRVAYTRLIGDAADSPVVDDEGSADQFFAGLAISYRF